jgi:hypothetical protein
MCDLPKQLLNDMDVIRVLYLKRATSAPTPRYHHPPGAGVSHFPGPTMSQVDLSIPENRVTLALAQARRNRHHATCRCHRFEGYCTANDALWSRAVDRELDEMRKP